MKKASLLLNGLCLVLLSNCGIVQYPGQPGMVSSSYVKLDLENLEEPGLFVYEAVYDNKPGGQGVGAIVTKLYPKAQTYTSNVRTNADGTLFRVKTAYEGADVQMISLPSLNQVMLNPNHKIMMMVEYQTSLDEIDEKNIAETNLFKPAESSLLSRALEVKKMRWDLLRAGSLTATGNLGYEVTGVQLKDHKFTPSKAVKLETTFFQNALKSDITTEVKNEFIAFLEANYPKGYQGTVQLHVKGSSQTIPVNLGLQTVKTLEASGTKIIKMALTKEVVDDVLKRFKSGTLKEGSPQ